MGLVLSQIIAGSVFLQLQDVIQELKLDHIYYTKLNYMYTYMTQNVSTFSKLLSRINMFATDVGNRTLIDV